MAAAVGAAAWGVAPSDQDTDSPDADRVAIQQADASAGTLKVSLAHDPRIAHAEAYC